MLVNHHRAGFGTCDDGHNPKAICASVETGRCYLPWVTLEILCVFYVNVKDLRAAIRDTLVSNINYNI